MFEQIYAWIAEQLAGNDVFAGLVGASAIGTLLFVAHSVPATLWRMAVRHLTVELTVHSTDPAFEWIRLWLTRHPYGGRARRLWLTARNRHDGDDVEDERPEWAFAPGEGLHLFMHGGRPVALWRSIDRKVSRGLALKETLVLRAVGRNQAFLRSLVDEAIRIGYADDRVRIYGWFGYWQLVARKRRRPLETVILPDGLMELIVEDAARFFDAEDWYVERGVPYRRGYLFLGPPGTGKSSLALAMAGHFGRPLYTLNLSAMGNDSTLAETFADVPQDAILVLEDVDTCKAAMSRAANHDRDRRRGGPTLAGLLNAIDGVASSDGRLLIMTSNHPEKLDPALVRPGRVDLRLPFRLLGRKDVRRMYLRFHPGEEENAETFATLVPVPTSAAELQRRLMGADPMAGLCIERTPAVAE
jgi:chaperone BCS1